jgi:uncharacterized protein with von Willebrand factor type A (vWA) domain
MNRHQPDSDFGTFTNADREDSNSILELLRAHRAESKEWRDEQKYRMGKMETEMATMRQQLQQNTDMTATVRDVMTTARVATAVIKWVGGIAIAVGSMWWAVKEIVSTAGNITPGP